MEDQTSILSQEEYIAVPPMLIRPWAKGGFAVFLRHEDSYVLYTNKGQAFTNEHRQKLTELKSTAVFVPRKQKGDYEYYLRENLDSILVDSDIPMDVRSEAWRQASFSLVREVFDEKLPKQLKRHKFSQVQKLVDDSLQFFNQVDSLPRIIRLVSKGYKNYTHAIATMVLTSFLLMEHPECDEELLIKVGVGAILHDIGKVGLPPALLNKAGHQMSAEERELFRSHPCLGVGLCMQLPLSLETHHCILFHHEKENGVGYPSGIKGDSIPFYLKALSLANAYDQMTRATPWRAAHRPFEAMKRIENRMEQYSPDMFKRLIQVLSAADLM